MTASGRAIAIVSLTVAAAFPLVQFALLFPMTSEMPTWDQWNDVEVFAAHYEHRPVLPLLLKPYNGHYNVVPRMIFYILGLLTHWNVKVEVVASYVMCGGTLAVLLAMLRETDSRLLILAAPVSASIFSIAGFENFLSGYPLCQTISLLASVAALFFLTRRESSRNRYWIALFLALVASFSWGAAVAVWPVGLLLLAGERPVRRGRLALWVLAGAGCAALARIAVARVPQISVDWPSVGPFFLALLGAPYTSAPRGNVHAAEISGIAAVLLLPLLVALAVREKKVDAPSVRRWTAVGLLALGSAALIAIARSSPDLRGAFTSHYTGATSLLGVALLVLLGVILGGGSRLGRGSPLAVCAVAALFFLNVVAISARWLPVLRRWSNVGRRNDAALMRGTATDAQIEQSLFPLPQVVRDSLPILREHRLAAYRHGTGQEHP